jgi:hypothetical protein
MGPVRGAVGVELSEVADPLLVPGLLGADAEEPLHAVRPNTRKRTIKRTLPIVAATEQ